MSVMIRDQFDWQSSLPQTFAKALLLQDSFIWKIIQRSRLNSFSFSGFPRWSLRSQMAYRGAQSILPENQWDKFPSRGAALLPVCLGAASWHWMWQKNCFAGCLTSFPLILIQFKHFQESTWMGVPAWRYLKLELNLSLDKLKGLSWKNKCWVSLICSLH